MHKKDIYKDIFMEVVNILSLFPEWDLIHFIEDEELDYKNPFPLYTGLKQYRERLEIDNHVFCDDEETQQIMDEGLRIHSLIVKEYLYGSDEEDF